MHTMRMHNTSLSPHFPLCVRACVLACVRALADCAYDCVFNKTVKKISIQSLL